MRNDRFRLNKIKYLVDSSDEIPTMHIWEFRQKYRQKYTCFHNKKLSGETSFYAERYVSFEMASTRLGLQACVRAGVLRSLAN